MGAILIIYTGGTIGMKANPATGALAPFNFEQILHEVPELHSFESRIDAVSLIPLVDSSDATPEFWERLVVLIEANYADYDGFVILHGTDTMAYTASALSFMLPNVQKPVILTGSQLPIGALRTDGKENLLCALEIAEKRAEDGAPLIPEVAVFFDHSLTRGNRTTKFGAERFDAFRSFNYPRLAEVGIHVRYNRKYIRERPAGPLTVDRAYSTRVSSLRLYPGIRHDMVERVLTTPGLRGLVLETFGAGNAPSAPWFLDLLRGAVDRGMLLVNISQCPSDSISMTSYDVGLGLARLGVVSGRDMTFEAALAKLMMALRRGDIEAAKAYFGRDIAGEMTLAIVE